MRTMGTLQQVEVISMAFAVGITVGTSMAYILFISLRALFMLL